MASVARKMVSQKKKRYQQDGFDLDLSCESPTHRPRSHIFIRNATRG